MKKRIGYGYLINTIAIVGEFLIINILFLIMMYFFQNYLDEKILLHKRVIWMILNFSYLPTLFLNYQKFHEVRIFKPGQILGGAFFVSILHLLLFSSILTFLKVNDLSRLFILLQCGIYYILLATWWSSFHFALKRYRKQGYNFRNVILIGYNQNIEFLNSEISSHVSFGYRVCGYFSDTHKNVPSMKYLGKIEDAKDYVYNNHIDEIYCSLSGNYDSFIAEMLNLCDNNMIRFNFIPLINNIFTRNMKLELLGNTPILVPREEPLNDMFAQVIKRGFDIVFSLLVLFFSPFWLLPCAFAVKLSSRGPVFFKQLRTGKEGKEFWCYKFRSMKVNSQSDSVQATRNDPRKTKVGNFLRKTNLDELPQFINILKGDMSVVGPRPHMLKHTEMYSSHIEKYMLRHLVKPGLTGWAQVNGYRGETKEDWQMMKRVEYDIWYMENWSFWLDLKIIYKTGYNMLKSDKNAF